MGHRPSAWMTELVEGVAGCMEAHSPMGALGWRYHEDEELVELVVYPTPVELVGGEHDGTIVIPGFSLNWLRVFRGQKLLAAVMREADRGRRERGGQKNAWQSKTDVARE